MIHAPVHTARPAVPLATLAIPDEGPDEGLDEGDAFDHHVLACMVAIAGSEGSLTAGLGLSAAEVTRLIETRVPEARGLLVGLNDDQGPGEEALEEEDLRALLIEHGASASDKHGASGSNRPGACGSDRQGAGEIEFWLAAILARRSLRPNHLWQDLGLRARSDLSGLLVRHFPGLAARNVQNMKWKKFFYRELCRREGVVVCKAPHCAACDDHAHCFGGEDGPALLALRG
ncbi:hydrogenase [Rhodospirillum rubrum]|uniref:nitrogen fixation protein NifQ n=1 Tax=Rhodospirillum rubrum TaxID=1085 RepID=UPI00190662EA|nr:nitrogen fixation protein NifQ [Rhodospirillum rubrum]MBK1666068.1 hydrogenase [Rhodospirillum rubrum]MBK1677153.1 hydrogenase [Rhodospirillum rubrum]